VPIKQTVKRTDRGTATGKPVNISPETFSKEWYVALAEGLVPGWSVVHKFGAANVGTTYTPVCEGGFYRTPQVASATLQGLDATGAEITETLATNGASASSATTNSFLRLHRFWVSSSGTYATQSTGSHVGDIVIEDSAGTQDWATIVSTDFPKGQSQIGVYSIPTGKTGYIQEVFGTVDSNKTMNIAFFQRKNILETAAPYTPMRLITEMKGISGPFNLLVTTPINGFTGPCDIGFMAKVPTGTGDLTVDFEIMLKDT
jgi:hypothetical protein